MNLQQTTASQEWFGQWFDSPYYHLLYRHRDTVEAQHFMDRLVSFMNLSPQSSILDLGCGKGRHAIYLNQKGFPVTGLDLSSQSIAFAQQFSNDKLRFEVHDMRLPYEKETFDIVLNLFTSFGFFATDEEHLNTIEAVAQALKPGGFFVIDFFNTQLVTHALLHKNEEIRDGITFQLHRHIENKTIIKDIRFEDRGHSYHFQERVRALEEEDFRSFFSQANLQLIHLFGNYRLDFYMPNLSDRMIFIVQKPKKH